MLAALVLGAGGVSAADETLPAAAPDVRTAETQPAGDGGSMPTGPVGKAPQPKETQPTQVADVLERRGILTPRGTLVVEPQFQYTNSSLTQVTLEGYTILPALLIGSINIDSVRHDTATTAFGFRYGITSHLEAELRIPFVRSDDQISSRPLNQGSQQDTVTKVWGQGLGDIEAAVHYQFNDGDDGWPYFVGNLRIKSDTGRGPFQVPTDANGLQVELPTGTGFWAVQPSVTFTLPSDPAVFYGSLSYLWNRSRSVDIQGSPTIAPGNAIGVNLGMGLALNQDASFSLGYSHNTVQPARENGEVIAGSERLQVGVLLVGLSYRVRQRTTINFNLGVGVTQDAPNVQVTLGIPLSFALHK
jgi:hypothetical protein